MARTKYFTEQVTGGSPGEASREDMLRGFFDVDDEQDRKMWDEVDLWADVAPGQGGVVGRAKGWER